MDIVYHSIFGLHFVGVAAIFYGFFKELSHGTKGTNVAMLHGVSTQLATGILMVGLRESGVVEDDDVLNHSKVALKLGIALLILITVVVGKRSKSSKEKYWLAVGVLTVVNMLVAYLVH